MNTMVKDLGHVTMYFSTQSMYEVHAIENVAVIKIKNIDHVLVNQIKSSHKTIKKLKNTIQTTGQ